jgi:CDP-diacylglycerol--glycerol-3-phosphate 3-phosphatidyltransferase
MATPPVERSPRGRGNGPRDYQTEFRNRLIDSRLTPNAISLTGFALCLVAAGLIWQGWWIAGGIAFIVGSVCDTLDGRYSRMSGKASPFGAFLDSTLDRVEEGVVLAAVAYRFSRDEDLTFILSNDIAVAAVVFGDLKAIEPAVYVLAVMAVVTVFQRIFHVRSELTKPVTEAV